MYVCIFDTVGVLSFGFITIQCVAQIKPLVTLYENILFTYV